MAEAAERVTREKTKLKVCARETPFHPFVSAVPSSSQPKSTQSYAVQSPKLKRQQTEC